MEVRALPLSVSYDCVLGTRESKSNELEYKMHPA